MSRGKDQGVVHLSGEGRRGEDAVGEKEL